MKDRRRLTLHFPILFQGLQLRQYILAKTLFDRLAQESPFAPLGG
jgi:hypothetical protein